MTQRETSRRNQAAAFAVAEEFSVGDAQRVVEAGKSNPKINIASPRKNY
jgi:hypothetical protein